MSYLETKSRVCSFVHASESFFKALHQTKVNTLQQVSLGHHDMCWSTRNHYRYRQFCWKYIMPLRLSLSRLLRLTFEFSAVSSMGCCAILSSGAESCSCNLHHSLWGQGSEEYQNHLPFGIPSRGFRWKHLCSYDCMIKCAYQFPSCNMESWLYICKQITNKKAHLVQLYPRISQFMNKHSDTISICGSPSNFGALRIQQPPRQGWGHQPSSVWLHHSGVLMAPPFKHESLKKGQVKNALFRSVWSLVHHDLSECINVLFWSGPTILRIVSLLFLSYRV